MASLSRLAILFSCEAVATPLPHYANGHWNEAQASSVHRHAIVARFDERFEARAEWQLHTAANVEAEVVLRGSGAESVAGARTVKAASADHVGRESGRRQREHGICRECGNADVPTSALKSELVVRCLEPQANRRRRRAVAH